MMMFLLGLFCGAAVGWLGIALLSTNRLEDPPLAGRSCSCSGGNRMSHDNGGHMTSRDMHEGSMCG